MRICVILKLRDLNTIFILLDIVCYVHLMDNIEKLSDFEEVKVLAFVF